jgi:hypothetical protein
MRQTDAAARCMNLVHSPGFHQNPRSPCSLGLSTPASSTFLSEQTSHQQPASSTILSEQTSTSHQPPANRTGWLPLHPQVKGQQTQLRIWKTSCRQTPHVHELHIGSTTSTSSPSSPGGTPKGMEEHRRTYSIVLSPPPLPRRRRLDTKPTPTGPYTTHHTDWQGCNGLYPSRRPSGHQWRRRPPSPPTAT